MVVVVVVVGGATLSQIGYATFLPMPHAPTPRSSLMKPLSPHVVPL